MKQWEFIMQQAKCPGEIGAERLLYCFFIVFDIVYRSVPVPFPPLSPSAVSYIGMLHMLHVVSMPAVEIYHHAATCTRPWHHHTTTQIYYTHYLNSTLFIRSFGWLTFVFRVAKRQQRKIQMQILKLMMQIQIK